MANAIPLWLTGRHVSAVTARWQLPNSSGVFTNGASTIQTLFGFVDEIDLQGEQTTQNVVSLQSTIENYVPVEVDDSFVFTEIMRSKSGLQTSGPPYNGGNYLAELWYNSDNAGQALFTVTRGGNVWSAYLALVDYSETIRKPKSTAQLTCRMISLYDSVTNIFPQPNPAYA